MHWQTTSVEHLALGVAGLGYEGSIMYIGDCFETSPNVVGVVMVATV